MVVNSCQYSVVPRWNQTSSLLCVGSSGMAPHACHVGPVPVPYSNTTSRRPHHCQTSYATFCTWRMNFKCQLCFFSPPPLLFSAPFESAHSYRVNHLFPHMTFVLNCWKCEGKRNTGVPGFLSCPKVWCGKTQLLFIVTNGTGGGGGGRRARACVSCLPPGRVEHLPGDWLGS